MFPIREPVSSIAPPVDVMILEAASSSDPTTFSSRSPTLSRTSRIPPPIASII